MDKLTDGNGYINGYKIRNNESQVDDVQMGLYVWIDGWMDLECIFDEIKEQE